MNIRRSFMVGLIWRVLLLLVLAILVFGPEKLPKMIQDAAQFLRRIREFSDSAKRDIRAELGPEFKDFEFEDLHPKTFARKHLLNNDDLKEIRDGFDLRKDVAEITEAVNGIKSDLSDRPRRGGGSRGAPGGDLLAKRSDRPAEKEPVGDGPTDTPPPFDADAT